MSSLNVSIILDSFPIFVYVCVIYKIAGNTFAINLICIFDLLTLLKYINDIHTTSCLVFSPEISSFLSKILFLCVLDLKFTAQQKGFFYLFFLMALPPIEDI